MSREYDLYLEEHKGNVAKGYRWIRENLPELIELYHGNEFDLEQQICFQHDASKTEMDEYVAYDRYFYGGPQGKSYGAVKEFNYAWLRHIHRNPHHWQYWVLINDSPEEGEIIMDMPLNYILEMICDWWAFSWKKGDLSEIFGWYVKHREYMKLSLETRKTVEMILDKIREKLDEIGGTVDTTLQEIIDELNMLITDLSAEFYETFDHHLQRRLQAVESARDIIIGHKEVADSISKTFGLPVEVLLEED